MDAFCTGQFTGSGKFTIGESLVARVAEDEGKATNTILQFAFQVAALPTSHPLAHQLFIAPCFFASTTLSLLAASSTLGDATGLPANFTSVVDHSGHRRLATFLPHPEFDIFVLSTYWWPGHCGYSGAGIPLCEAIPKAWESNMVVHGLWPSYSDIFKNGDKTMDAGPDGVGNPECGGEDYIAPSDFTAAATGGGGGGGKKGKKAAAAAPSYFVALPANDLSMTPATIADQKVFPGRGVSLTNADFYSHEYNKHGKCSGLTRAQYFAETVAQGRLINEKAALVPLARGTTVAYSKLQKEFGSLSEIVCHGKGKSVKTLWFVNTCFERDEEMPNSIGAQTICPKVGLDCANAKSAATATVAL